MKAIIMAGGQGTRLRPLTSDQPKPMIRIVNLPCMEHIVNLLSRHGITDIAVTLQFMPEEIQDYFGDGSEWGVNMRYSIEDAPAGTAGSVKMAEQQLGLEGERLLIISGDALTDADLSRLVEFHEEKGSEATMVLKSVENPLDFGIVITEEDGRISRFLEKPAWGQVFSDTVNTGIYLLEPSVMDEIPDPEDGEYDFSKELFPALLEEGRPLYGYVTDDYWEDIGTLEQFAGAQRDVLDGKVNGVRPPGTRLRESIYVGRRAQVDDDELEGPLVIGENVRVDEGAKISPYSVFSDNGVISAGATVERSVVAEGTYVGEGAELIDTLVGRNSYVQARARLLERSALGDDVIVGEGATVAPEVTIYPHKTIESGAIVTLGRDSSLSAQVAKRAMTAALLGTGINIRDRRAAHAGVVRHDVLAGKSSAGAHVRAGSDPDDVEILFFSADATPITEGDERSVEKAFVREEYRRAYGGDIGELIYPGRVVEQFVERLERAVDREKTSGTTIVVDFCGGVAGLVASRVFSRLGVSAVVMEGFANANAVGEAGRMNLEESIERVARIVPTVDAVFGAVVGPEAEYVQFVDDEGEWVPPDVMLACLISQMHPQSAVLPINLSRGYERLVEEGEGAVEMSRTGLSNVAIKAADIGADLASLADGRYIFPTYLPAPDCFMTLASTLEVFREAPLSTVRRKFGDSFDYVHREPIECPWSAKGRVMRGLAEKFGGDPDAILAEGVLLNVEDGWVLMLPDPDSPMFYVYAESGDSDGSPEQIMEEYVNLVKSLIDDQALLSS